jgi:cyanophycinase
VGHGSLLIIGGKEDKTGEKLILRELVQMIGSGKLVVSTVASGESKEIWADYERAFRSLGCRHVWHLEVGSREDAMSERAIRILDDATAVFFTGGDQLKITSQLGDTPIYARIREIYESGGTIAGTSAGASVMCETMLVSGNGHSSHRIGDALRMAPGFGLVDGLIIDQHFAERGRIGRLVAAVSQNPRLIGLGLDENTAVLVRRQKFATVIGDGAVYVVDGRRVTSSNIALEAEERTLSVFDVKLHLLSMGDKFDLGTRCPSAGSARALEQAILD